MIMLSICMDDKHIDISLDPHQKINDAIKVMNEQGYLPYKETYEIIGTKGRRINTYMSFHEAKIYSGEKLILK